MVHIRHSALFRGCELGDYTLVNPDQSRSSEVAKRDESSEGCRSRGLILGFEKGFVPEGVIGFM